MRPRPVLGGGAARAGDRARYQLGVRGDGGRATGLRGGPAQVELLHRARPVLCLPSAEER